MIGGPMRSQNMQSHLNKNENGEESENFIDYRNQYMPPINIYDLPPTPSPLQPRFDFSPMSPMYDTYNQMYSPQTFGNFNLNVQVPVDPLSSQMGGMSLNHAGTPPNMGSSASKLVLEPGLLKPGAQIAGGMPTNAEKASLYKTELCKKWMSTGACRYGAKCQFAHGHPELRTLVRHPLYKTTPCKTFQASGTCRYGSRCRFIHDESDVELNSVPRMPVRNSFSGGAAAGGGPPPVHGAGSYSSVSERTPNLNVTAGSGSGYVRFNNEVRMEMPSGEREGVANMAPTKLKLDDNIARSSMKMGKRVPSAPANLNLMDRPETLNLGMDANVGYDFSYEQDTSALDAEEHRATLTEKHFSDKAHLLRQQATKRNLTYHGTLNEGLSRPSPSTSQQDLTALNNPGRFKVGQGYKHMSASVSDFTRHWSLQDNDQVVAPSMDAKDLPVARIGANESIRRASPPQNPSGMLRSSLSSSRLQQLNMPRPTPSFQNTNFLAQPDPRQMPDQEAGLRARHNTEENVQINFFRNISDPELTDLN